MSFFFFNDPATTEIYTLSLHDALPICLARGVAEGGRHAHRRVGWGFLHRHHAAARAPGEQVGSQGRDDEQHRDADRRGLGENEPELAHGIGRSASMTRGYATCES